MSHARCQSRQLEDLETTYRAKIAGEVDRYDTLIAQREVANATWDKDNSAIIAAHDRHVAKLKKAHDEWMQDEQVRWHCLLDRGGMILLQCK